MFLTKLHTKFDNSTGRWILSKSLQYVGNDGWVVAVPKGFSTDLDSVPRIPFAYAWLKGRAVKSAVIHDWLYSKRHDRKEADKIFLEAMEEEGVPSWRRLPIYLAVRAFGWLAYI